MTTFTVVVQTESGRQTERYIPTLAEAEWVARDRSATGRDATSTEGWEGTGPRQCEGVEPLRYYESGERMNRMTGLPWTDGQTERSRTDRA